MNRRTFFRSLFAGAATAVVAPAALIRAPIRYYARGGVVKSKGLFLIAESGPESFVPLRRGDRVGLGGDYPVGIALTDSQPDGTIRVRLNV